MAETDKAGKEPEKNERDRLVDWSREFAGAAHSAKLQTALLYFTFEKMDAEAFAELEYMEAIWNLVNQLDFQVQELDQLMQKHVVPLREKAGVELHSSVKGASNG